MPAERSLKLSSRSPKTEVPTRSRTQPTLREDVRVTVTGGIASGLVEWAGIEYSDDGHGWRTRDGIESPDPAVAVTDAVFAIAEHDLAAECIERERADDDRQRHRPGDAG